MEAMREHGISEILTHDSHFAREGFTTLIWSAFHQEPEIRLRFIPSQRLHADSRPCQPARGNRHAIPHTGFTAHLCWL